MGSPRCRIIAYTSCKPGWQASRQVYNAYWEASSVCCHNCLLTCNSPTKRAAPQPVCDLGFLYGHCWGSTRSLSVILISCMATVGVQKGERQAGGGGDPPARVCGEQCLIQTARLRPWLTHCLTSFTSWVSACWSCMVAWVPWVKLTHCALDSGCAQHACRKAMGADRWIDGVVL
jgi:hypothetical protein